MGHLCLILLGKLGVKKGLVRGANEPRNNIEVVDHAAH
jgi:hypothetical protein